MTRLPISGLLLSLGCGALAVLVWSIGLRWLGLLGLVWMAALGLAMLRRFSIPVEKFLLYTFVFASSFRLDVYLVFIKGDLGFPINLSDVWWLCLMVLWFFRQKSEQGTVEWPRRFCIPFALLFLGVVIATVPMTYWSSRVRVWLYVVQAASLFLYLWNLRLAPGEYRRLGYWVTAAIVVQGAVGCLQGVTGSSLGLEFIGASSAATNTTGFTSFTRVGGTCGQPNRYAAFLLQSMFIPLALILDRQARGRTRLLLCGGFLLIVGGFIFSQSRGAWMGFAIAFVPFLYLCLREYMGRFLAGFAVSWVLLLAVAFVLLFPPTRERLMSEGAQESAYSRIPMALTALSMIQDNPFGVGFSQYVLRMNQYDVTQDGLTYHFRFPVHNAYLLLAAEQGIWVLLVYLLLLGCYYFLVIRMIGQAPGWPRMLGLAFAAGMLAVQIQEHVIISNITMNYDNYLGLGMAMNVLCMLQRRVGEQRSRSPQGGAVLDRPGLRPQPVRTLDAPS